MFAIYIYIYRFYTIAYCKQIALYMVIYSISVYVYNIFIYVALVYMCIIYTHLCIYIHKYHMLFMYITNVNNIICTFMCI